jgi:hypothetical protein
MFARVCAREPAPQALSIQQARDLIRRWAEQLRAEIGTADAAESVRAGQQERAVDALQRALTASLSAIRTPGARPSRQPQPRPERQGQDPLSRGVGGLLRAIGGEPRPDPPPRAQPPPGPVAIHRDLLADHARAACDALDDLLDAADPPAPAVTVRPWAEDRELVALFQDLLSARQTGHAAKALSRLDHLAGQLAQRHGIEVVEHSAQAEAAGWFSMATSSDASLDRIRTVRPALVASGRIVAVGEAVRPQATTWEHQVPPHGPLGRDLLGHQDPPDPAAPAGNELAEAPQPGLTADRRPAGRHQADDYRMDGGGTECPRQ